MFVCLVRLTAYTKMLIRAFRTVKDTLDVREHLVQYSEIRYGAGCRTQYREGRMAGEQFRVQIGVGWVWFCNIGLIPSENFKLIMGFLLSNFSFTQAWEFLNPGFLLAV